MNLRFLSGCALMIACCALTGCTLMEPVRDATRRSISMMRPSGADYRNDADEDIDDWAFVGEEARGDRPMESDPDPWWQQYIMSSRARNIERNLGIE